MLCHTCATLLALALLVAHPAVVSSSGVSPVQKVIQLIEDMEGKVRRDQTAGAKAFEDGAKNCDDVAVKKGYAIKDAKSDIESLSATVETKMPRSANMAPRSKKLVHKSALLSRSSARPYPFVMERWQNSKKSRATW